MTVPTTPSWHYAKGELELWDRWIDQDTPPDVTITGPLADKLCTVLSWVAQQSRMPEPEPEPGADTIDSETAWRWWRELDSIASDIYDRLS